MRTIVTGHLGFVGSHLCNELHHRGDAVIGLDLKDGNDINTCLLPRDRDVDRVFHLAAQVDASNPNARLDAWANIFGTLRILRYYGDKVVFASSSMVNYPITPYAISKRAAEDYARMHDAAVVRFCNLYGEGGHSVIDKFRDADTLTVYGNGRQRRTYARVEDAVKALLDAVPGTLTLLPGEDHRVIDLASATGKPITFAPARTYDPADATQLDLRWNVG